MKIFELLEGVVYDYGVVGVILSLIILTLFVIQFGYYVVKYNRILKSCASRSDSTDIPVSVISVIRGSEYRYIEEVLPKILAQKYPAFEVVLLDLSGDPEFNESLSLVAKTDSRISVTRLMPNPLFPISNKMALNMCIKAAHFDNILVTTTDAAPITDQWIGEMARGFVDSKVVLGYCGLEKKSSLSNKIMRLSLAHSAMRSLSRAIKGKPYRGYIGNIGFTKEAYFSVNGFNHLNLNIGEDDLFVQHLVRCLGDSSVGVVVNKNAIVRREQSGGLDWWLRERLLHSNAFRFYPLNVRCYIGFELWSRVFFFIVVIFALFFAVFAVKVLAASFLMLRFICVLIQTNRLSQRLEEKPLWYVLPIYDLLTPLFEASIATIRRFRRTPGLWR